jgi:predicted pyridoxine 5'-phosphate oxidase superfamily flavin-nucleotide-binding protein
MADKYMEMILTPAVRRAEDKYFGRHFSVAEAAESDPLGPDEISFISRRDSFYMASISESQWPYVQHRGGPPGFVKVIRPNLIAFADFKGNRQLISTGNLDVTDRVAIFMMDYPRRNRLKILGHARVLDAREHAELRGLLAPVTLNSRTERLFLIRVISFDWNCPQYITPRYTEEEIKESLLRPLEERIARLEKELAARKS